MIKVRIHKGEVAISDDLRIHVESRLGFALGRFADRIGRVMVRFTHADDDPGHAHKRCQIEVGLRPRRVDAEDTDADMFAAVNNATDRATRSVARALDREAK